MKRLQYNNFIGSGWVFWDEYLISYAKQHGSSDFISNYPNERSHMFREVYDLKKNKDYFVQIKNIIELYSIKLKRFSDKTCTIKCLKTNKIRTYKLEDIEFIEIIS